MEKAGLKKWKQAAGEGAEVTAAVIRYNENKTEKTEKLQAQNNKKFVQKEPGKKNPNWQGNRKNFKKFPPRKDGSENQNKNQ